MTRKTARIVLRTARSGWVVPAAIAAIAAAAELGGERWRLALRYDRGALEAGELWRLASGHCVHLGPSHMLMNVAALGVLAFVFANVLRSRDWLLAALTSAFAIDVGLFAFHSDVAWYVGLSGVLHGFWAAGCIRAFELRRVEAVPLTLLLVAKLAYEAALGPVPLTGAIAAGPVVTAAHAWGAAGGALVPLGRLATRYARRSL